MTASWNVDELGSTDVLVLAASVVGGLIALVVVFAISVLLRCAELSASTAAPVVVVVVPRPSSADIRPGLVSFDLRFSSFSRRARSFSAASVSFFVLRCSSFATLASCFCLSTQLSVGQHIRIVVLTTLEFQCSSCFGGSSFLRPFLVKLSFSF